MKDTSLLYCCDGCYGLFNCRPDLEDHLVYHHLSHIKSPEKFIAISSDCFLRFIKPHVKITDVTSQSVDCKSLDSDRFDCVEGEDISSASGSHCTTTEEVVTENVNSEPAGQICGTPADDEVNRKPSLSNSDSLSNKSNQVSTNDDRVSVQVVIHDGEEVISDRVISVPSNSSKSNVTASKPTQDVQTEVCDVPGISGDLKLVKDVNDQKSKTPSNDNEEGGSNKPQAATCSSMNSTEEIVDSGHTTNSISDKVCTSGSSVRSKSSQSLMEVNIEKSGKENVPKVSVQSQSSGTLANVTVENSEKQGVPNVDNSQVKQSKRPCKKDDNTPRKRQKRNTDNKPVTNLERPARPRRRTVVDYKLLNEGLVSEKDSSNPQSQNLVSECTKASSVIDISTNLTVDSTPESISRQSESGHEDDYSRFKKFVKMGKGNKVMYHCPSCPKKTPFIGFFRRHMKTYHNDGTGFFCEICGLQFPDTQKYRLHKNKHTRPFQCEECEASFVQKKDLLMHAKLHTGEYNFKCDHCDYQCRQSKSMKEHMRLHTGKMLHCSHPGCKFQTIYSFAMKAHILGRHMEASMYQCEECQYKTNTRGSLVRHMKIHLGIKNYKCGLCDYRGRAKHDVVKHMSVHTGIKRYQCPVCMYSTSHGNALRAHLLKHMGIRNWLCKMCPFVGSLKQHVIRHATKKHPEYNVEELVSKSNEVKMDLSDFEMGKVQNAKDNSGEILLENDVEEDPEAVTHIIFQDPENPGSEQIMTISTDQLEDQNVTIMTIDADSLEGVAENEGIDEQILTLATENENVMIITEGGEVREVKTVRGEVQAEEMKEEGFVAMATLASQEDKPQECVEETVVYAEHDENVHHIVIESEVPENTVTVPWKN